MNIDLNLFKVFHKVYAEKNLTKAARSLGLTQSAVSQALGRLRLHFNDELFIRISKGMEPTEKAHLIAPYISDSLNSAEKAFFADRKFNPMVSDHTFKIGMEDIDMVLLGPLFIKHFQKKAPNIKLEFIQIRSENYMEFLDQGEIKIAIHSIKIHPIIKRLPKRFSSVTVFHDELVVISKSKNPHINKKLTLDIFLNLPHLRVSMGNLDEKYIDPLYVSKGLKRNAPITIHHMLLAPMIVKETNLVATVFLTLMNYCKDLNGLDIHDFPSQTPSIPISLVWHNKIDNIQAYKWIIQEIQDLCKTIHSIKK